MVGARAGFTSPSIELDVRVGGEYRIAMQPPDGQLFHLRGAFLEVDRPRRLSYTFEWEEPDPDDQETVVKLTFREFGDGTELALEQGPFATDARLELHHRGWTDGFVRLERHLDRSILIVHLRPWRTSASSTSAGTSSGLRRANGDSASAAYTSAIASKNAGVSPADDCASAISRISADVAVGLRSGTRQPAPRRSR